MTDDPSCRAFYDAMGGGYTEAIRRCVPRYDEMLDQLLAALPGDFTPRRVLELGAGTGALTRRAARAWPGALLEAVDLSGAALRSAEQDLGNNRVRFVRSDIRSLEGEPGALDLVLSSLALHHLPDADKRDLFSRVFRWLRPGGWLAFADQFRGRPDHVYRSHIAAWRDRAREQGTPAEEWASWMDHQDRHDHHAPLFDQLRWLSLAGFEPVDCTWRHLLWAVVLARRPPRS